MKQKALIRSGEKDRVFIVKNSIFAGSKNQVLAPFKKLFIS